jgi:hypothetical protein
MKDKQALITTMISDKVALPNMTAIRERELLTKLYDTIEEIVGGVIDGL